MICKACGAQIRFVPLPNGKQMPVDAQPVPFIPDLNGPDKFVLEDGTILRGCAPLGGEPDVHLGWITHWATCKNSKYFDNMKTRRPHHD